MNSDQFAAASNTVTPNFLAQRLRFRQTMFAVVGSRVAQNSSATHTAAPEAMSRATIAR